MRPDRFPRSIAITLLALSCASGVKPDDGVTVTPAMLDTDRTIDLVPSDTTGLPDLSILFSVALKLKGEAVRNAAAYANLRLDEATDDTGASLLPKDFMVKANAERNLIRERHEDPDGAPWIIVSFALKQPPRKATKIVRFRGQVQVQSGGSAVLDVRVPKLKSSIGRHIANPALSAARVTMTPRNFANHSGPIFAIQAGGNLGAIRSLEVLDANGSLLCDAHLDDERGNGPALFTLALPRPLDDAMILHATLAVGQRVVTIPLDMKNVPLP